MRANPMDEVIDLDSHRLLGVLKPGTALVMRILNRIEQMPAIRRLKDVSAQCQKGNCINKKDAL